MSMGIEKFKPLVIVRCLAYNHEAYIVDALQGFVAQRTNFPFVVVIVNDASTDNTDTVVRSFINDNFDIQGDGYNCEDTDYAHIIHAYHKNNKNCLFYYLSLRINHFGKISHRPYYKKYSDVAKYWAECEGDDYWTDPYKLQKQVSYMESHEKCVCFAHNSMEYNTTQNVLSLFVKQRVDHCDFTLAEFIKKRWFTPTQSLLYRREALEISTVSKSYMHGDYSILMRLLLYPNSYLHYDNQVMSVYRAGGYASTHYDEMKLCDDFIELYKDIKAQSNHVCDDVFDKLIENQEKEKVHWLEYQRGIKKSRSLFVRAMHFVCRKIASVSNLYFDCLKVEKRVEKKWCPPLEELN